MLLNTQRNELFQILIAKGLQPSDFREENAGNSYELKLKKLSEIYFHAVRIKKDDSEYYKITKRPGSTAQPDRAEVSEPNEWGDYNGYYSFKTEFSAWAEAARAEVDSPDLWAENAKALQLFSSSSSLTSERFSVSELGAVQGQLRTLIQNFEVSDLPAEAKDKLILLARTALLKADAFNKKDWQNWIAGAFANSVSSLGLDERQIQEVIALVRQAFGGLFLQE